MPRDYSIEQVASLLTVGDSGAQRDSVSLIVGATLRRTAAGGTAGLVRSATIAGAGRTATAIPGVGFPFAFAVDPLADRGQAAFSAPAIADACRSPAAVALAPLRDLLFRVPDTLAVGGVWADSGVYQTCRDGTLLSVSGARRFVVRSFTRRADDVVVLVDRSTRVLVRGVRTRGSDTTRVDGNGTGSLTYELDAKTGAVLSAAGSSTLDVVIRGRTRVERVSQRASSRITIRPN